MNISHQQPTSPDEAKKRVSRYKYWCIKDEKGTVMFDSEGNDDGRTFDEYLDLILLQNIDKYVQVRCGTNSSSVKNNNTAMFILVKEDESTWIPPEEQTVNINGTAHKVDSKGNVNINFPKIEPLQPDRIESATIDVVSQKLELQLQGLRDEHSIKEQSMRLEMENKLALQNLEFQKMLLNQQQKELERREQECYDREQGIFEKEQETQNDLKGYIKHVPSALSGLVKDWMKDSKNEAELSGTEKPNTEPKKRKKVQFEVNTDNSEENEDLSESDDVLDGDELADQEEPSQNKEENQTD